MALASSVAREALIQQNGFPDRWRKLPPEVLEQLMRRRRHADYPGLLICPLEACDADLRSKITRRRVPPCPAHCTNVSCPGRNKHEPLIPWLRRNMEVLRPLLPQHPPPLAAPNRRRLLLVTTTFQSEQQLIRLEHLAAVLSDEPDCYWVVVEDAAAPSGNVSALLASMARVPYVHLAFGPTRRGGNAQRNLALQHIRSQKLVRTSAEDQTRLQHDSHYHSERHCLQSATACRAPPRYSVADLSLADDALPRLQEGIVYNLDDDNGYHPRLWNELRALRPNRVGVLAVRRAVYPPPRCDGRFLPLLGREKRLIKVERPVYENATGAFVRFDAVRLVAACFTLPQPRCLLISPALMPTSLPTKMHANLQGWCTSTSGKQSWMTRRYGARTYCVDMGGFAFDAVLLRRITGETLWSYSRHGGGESELIHKLLPGGSPADLQPLANCGRDVSTLQWAVEDGTVCHVLDQQSVPLLPL